MEKLLDRFCRYVKVDTTANDKTEDYPSSSGQLELGKMLAEEMKALGFEKVKISEYGIVTGTIPGNRPEAPTIAWLAHMDTSPEAPGKDVKPQIIENYDGTDITLPGDTSKVIRVDETPILATLKGKTVITSDGTTLLGADDKAGVAIIMTAAERLLADDSLPRGPITVCFSCDEEIGRGADHIDPKELGAVVAYTLDGAAAGEVECETFSADLATVRIRGENIHPGMAKDKMINAIRLGSQFVARLPWHFMAPESTSDREGFLHPYVFEGGVAECEIKILLRSFETSELAEQAEMLQHIARGLMAEFPKARIDVEIKKQYRNMREGLEKEPRAMGLAVKAMEKLGVTYKVESIRGGTDGSRLTEMGLPTPNLFAGMHNIHAKTEFGCLEEMELAVDMLVELAGQWGQER